MKKKFEKTVGNGKRNLSVITLLIMVSSIIIGITNMSEAVIAPGHYVIYKEGGTYYAQNGQTGVNDYSGTDARTVIQSAINTGPGVITLKSVYGATTYQLSASLSLISGCTLVGEGRGAVALEANGDFPVITIDNVSGTAVRHLVISGFGKTYTSADGIYVNNISETVIEDVRILHCRNGLRFKASAWDVTVKGIFMNDIYNGILSEPKTGVSTSWNGLWFFKDIYIVNPSNDGIHLDQYSGCRFDSIDVDGAVNDALVLKYQSDGTTQFDNCWFGSMGGNALRLANGVYGYPSEIFFNNCAFDTTVGGGAGTGTHGIYVESEADGVHITGGRIVANQHGIYKPLGVPMAYKWMLTGVHIAGSQSIENTYDDIHMYSMHYVNMTGCLLGAYPYLGKQSNYAIRIRYSVGGNFIHVVGNLLAWHNQSDPVVIEYSGQWVSSNYGYATDRSGVASVANGGTITHGLVGTPTGYGVTATVAGRIAVVTAVNATNLTIGLHDYNGNPVTTPENVSWIAKRHLE